MRFLSTEIEWEYVVMQSILGSILMLVSIPLIFG